MDELLGEFIAETRETLGPLVGEVVAWEAAPGDRARLDAIFRFVHTVKGSCGFLDLPRLERLSHAAEGALAEVREGRRTPDGVLVSAVLAIIDRIGEMVEALDAGEAFPEGGDDALILALEPGQDHPVSTAHAHAHAPAPAAAPAPAVARAAARSIRLPVDLLDRMMGGVSDLVLARNELSRRLRDAGHAGHVDAAFERLSGCIAEMREAITRTRMQRIENLFSALPRMVRDLGHELGKPVSLLVEGEDVELDREMIEMIRDPLTHIVRNAVDHGLESAEERARAGKPATGALRVTARQAGNQILIDIADDGRGVDSDRLVAKAVAAGILTVAEAQALPEARKLSLMFEPGLSTASAVTAISGRGVGMDIVRANIERIGGVVELASRPRVGTRLTLRVPLTLTIIPALTITAGGQDFALPRAAIDEIVRVSPKGARLEHVGDATVAVIRDRRLPVLALGEVLGLGGGDGGHPSTLVVLRPSGGQPFALGVDMVHDHEELVIKPAAPAVMATGLYAGTTLPDSGRPMLLLDPGGIAAVGGVALDIGAVAAPVAEGPVEETIRTLLFRDLDGADRAVRLGMVERIEDVPGDAVRLSGGRVRLAHKGRIIPVLGRDVPTDGRKLRVLMMSDGAAELAYAIAEVTDIVHLGRDIVPTALPGPVAGVVLVDGRQVELLDPHWLFATVLDARAPAERPLCLLLDGADRWTREVLRPLVESAGYRVALEGEADPAEARVIIAGSERAAPDGLPAPVVRLREHPERHGADDRTIYRYDREGLMAALRAGTGA
ncbi:chemotaxis protein CheA [Sphingomonas quercus]|uniref:Chemotaxis protein CheW n=1 Tax=Sphingomonas quercus TaxID=2842451 RepID=A0ABS6BJN6_9SPHN|nr:chemotaxis protein CheW [Sphingomonas quercus]MBU3078394.1 chemotaxis protein CheW [Sphingomonas quercus]